MNPSLFNKDHWYEKSIKNTHNLQLTLLNKPAKVFVIGRLFPIKQLDNLPYGQYLVRQSINLVILWFFC